MHLSSWPPPDRERPCRWATWDTRPWEEYSALISILVGVAGLNLSLVHVQTWKDLLPRTTSSLMLSRSKNAQRGHPHAGWTGPLEEIRPPVTPVTQPCRDGRGRFRKHESTRAADTVPHAPLPPCA